MKRKTRTDKQSFFSVISKNGVEDIDFISTASSPTFRESVENYNKGMT